ncbi:MAG: tetratricopeptide repeat protein [Acidobacteriota bacterium]
MKYLLFVVMLVTACSCSQQEREPAPAPSATHTAEPTDVIDQNLMIALSQAKNFHHKAKVYMSDGKLDDAIASVREILSLQFPAGAPEADDVRDDARALLAKLLVGKGELDEAMRVVNEGLAASSRESFFVANLYTVQGEIHEARAAQLAGAQAADEKRAAIASYDKSIEIDAKLQKKLMEEK